jgi:hypothetical protein
MRHFPRLCTDHASLVIILHLIMKLYIKLLSHSSSGNPFRTFEKELLKWLPAIGFPCLDADDCANPSNAALIPDVEVRPAILF